jgi:hypothetical protein
MNSSHNFKSICVITFVIIVHSILLINLEIWPKSLPHKLNEAVLHCMCACAYLNDVWCTYVRINHITHTHKLLISVPSSGCTVAVVPMTLFSCRWTCRCASCALASALDFAIVFRSFLADLVQSFDFPSAAAKSTSSSHQIWHRVHSYIAGDDSSTNFTVVWCGSLIRLRRGLNNCRLKLLGREYRARTLRLGVHASGTPATHRRRVHGLHCSRWCVHPVHRPVCNSSLFEGSFNKMLA